MPLPGLFYTTQERAGTGDGPQRLSGLRRGFDVSNAMRVQCRRTAKIFVLQPWAHQLTREPMMCSAEVCWAR